MLLSERLFQMMKQDGFEAPAKALDEFNALKSKYTTIVLSRYNVDMKDTVLSWTNETVGVQNFTYHLLTFWFENPDDAVMFKLMWGHLCN